MTRQNPKKKTAPKKKASGINKHPKPSKYTQKIKVNATFDEVVEMIVRAKKTK